MSNTMKVKMFEVLAAHEEKLSVRSKAGCPGYLQSRKPATIMYLAAKKLAAKRDAEKALIEKKRYIRKLFNELKAAELEFVRAIRTNPSKASVWGQEVAALKAAIRQANLDKIVATEVVGW